MRRGPRTVSAGPPHCSHPTSARQARNRDRTGDLILTKDVLYRLSYACIVPPDSLHPSSFVLKKSGRRGSNPRHQAWKACALPAELLPHSLLTSPISHLPYGGGRIRTFEGISRQIYSLLPLATWVPHPTASVPTVAFTGKRADGEDRTRDRPITNRVLYQLSYVGETEVLRELSRIVGAGRRVNLPSPPPALSG